MTPHSPSSSFLQKLKALWMSSVILCALDRFSEAVYRRLKTGWFSAIFTAYPSRREKRPHRPSPFQTPFRAFRRFIARTVDESGIAHGIRVLTQYLLRCRLRVYGTFLITLGSYTLISCLYARLGAEGEIDLTSAILSVVLIGSAIPLLLSNVSLSEAVLQAGLLSPILSFLGIRRESLYAKGHAGRSNLAFVVGMLLGFATFFIPILYILLGLIGVFLAYRVLVSPETGVAVLFFCMPFLPTMVLVLLVCYTALCYGSKLLIGKRKMHLQRVDVAALLFAFAIACSGVFSFSSGSRKPALVFLCFLSGYFLTVCMIRTREWLVRCTWSAISASVLVALIGVCQYFFGAISDANAWLDADMFGDIAGRVTSTLENPNMLAEYLIMLFPLAAAQLLIRTGSRRKACAFFACAAVGVCIILTWSRGAWLGLLLCGLLFLLIWNRRSIYLILAGVAAVPVLPLFLPDSIVSRFTSIGNLADTSTSYRVNIWRGAVHMLRDYWSCGIGIGEAAWNTVYPRYALASIETAPHAHNLYLQVWIETGIIGLLLLLAFLFLLLQCNFSYYNDLCRMRECIDASARMKPVRHNSGIQTQQSDFRHTDSEITALRLEAAAPMCGLIAALFQGLTDYTWYNYRVYLMFWMIAGLSVAYVRCGQAELSRIHDQQATRSRQPDDASLEIPLQPRKRKTS